MKVMIIDDDEDTRILLTEDLRDLGLEAVWAVDATQALPIARRERPALIILDYRLPGGDGATVLRRLKQASETASIPVIVFSRQRSPQIVDDVLSLGADAYVQKSFANNQLRERILEFLPPKTWATPLPPLSPRFDGRPTLPPLRLSTRFGVEA